jgi:gliding motility associated protien GldN
MRASFLSKLIGFVIAAVITMPSNAQVSNVLDGAYVKETNITKRVVPYPYLREADVMYTKRIWQKIDLREKMNQQFYYPIRPIQDRQSLFDVIREALTVEGSLVAYSTGPAGDDDEFRYPLTSTKIDSILNPVIYIPEIDLETGEKIGDKPKKVAIESESIKQYLIKEDWIWDRQRSERYVRIIGIAPLMEQIDDEGQSKGFSTLFWLYYPECRYVFANSEVYNMFNDAQRRTYEDVFQKRYFSSYVVKESNVYDRSIQSYARGLDALGESRRIKEELFMLEHDLWHY